VDHWFFLKSFSCIRCILVDKIRIPLPFLFLKIVFIPLNPKSFLTEFRRVGNSLCSSCARNWITFVTLARPRATHSANISFSPRVPQCEKKSRTTIPNSAIYVAYNPLIPSCTRYITSFRKCCLANKHFTESRHLHEIPRRRHFSRL